MDLHAYCDFLEKLSRIPILVVEEDASLTTLCDKALFHRLQDYLYPAAFLRLLETVEENQLVRLVDVFQIRFLLGKVHDTAFVVGPFCCESLSTLDARLLLERLGIAKGRVADMLSYRSQFVVTPENEIIRAVRILISQCSGAEQMPPLRSIDLRRPFTPGVDEPVERPYAEIVSDRYAVETDLMRSIEQGNVLNALRDWRQLHQRMDYRRTQEGHTLENARLSASITRTVIRVAGMRAGVPPIILDELTGKISRRNQRAKSLDEIESNTETLILELCREIRRERQQQASYLVSSVQYHIDSHFAEDLTIAMVAEHLDMAESRLIELFRRETGVTPGQYLRTVRLRRAAELLAGTRLRVQEIAAGVGIPDANYFVKLFRREYGLTPSVFRKNAGLRTLT